MLAWELRLLGNIDPTTKTKGWHVVLYEGTQRICACLRRRQLVYSRCLLPMTLTAYCLLLVVVVKASIGKTQHLHDQGQEHWFSVQARGEEENGPISPFTMCHVPIHRSASTARSRRAGLASAVDRIRHLVSTVLWYELGLSRSDVCLCDIQPCMEMFSRE